MCNKTALYTDLFVDQFFIDVIGKCSPSAKAIEYEPSGQWKAVGEEKPSRRAQRERDAYKAAQATKNSNGKSMADVDQSPDDDSDDDRSRSSRNSSSSTQAEMRRVDTFQDPLTINQQHLFTTTFLSLNLMMINICNLFFLNLLFFSCRCALCECTVEENKLYTHTQSHAESEIDRSSVSNGSLYLSTDSCLDHWPCWLAMSHEPVETASTSISQQ